MLDHWNWPYIKMPVKAWKAKQRDLNVCFFDGRLNAKCLFPTPTELQSHNYAPTALKANEDLIAMLKRPASDEHRAYIIR